MNSFAFLLPSQGISGYEHPPDYTYAGVNYDDDTRSIITNSTYFQGIGSSINNISFHQLPQQQMTEHENNACTPPEAAVKICKHNAFDCL